MSFNSYTFMKEEYSKRGLIDEEVGLEDYYIFTAMIEEEHWGYWKVDNIKYSFSVLLGIGLTGTIFSLSRWACLLQLTWINELRVRSTRRTKLKEGER